MARETYHETMEQLLLLIRAGYPIIYIVSHEESRVLDCLARIHSVILTSQPRKRLFRWAQGTGLLEIQGIAPAPAPHATPGWLDVPPLPASTREVPRGNAKASEAMDAIRTATPTTFAELADSVTVFFDIHPYLMGPQFPGLGGELVRPLRNAADALRRYYDERRVAGDSSSKTIVIVSPTDAGLSQELERDLIRLRFPLPERDELLAAIRFKIGSNQLAFPDPLPQADVEELSKGEQLLSAERYRNRLCELIAGAGCGLTLEDFKLGLNKIAARRQPLAKQHIEDMLDLKAKAISNRALTYTPHVNIELGGLEKVKAWTNQRRGAVVSAEIRERFMLPPPRGVMLCGASGGGKSQLAKLIAKEFGLALLRLDIGSLFGQYVGESEQRAREALDLAEVLAPVVLWIDEIDKAFAGMGGKGDNGVSTRVFGYFLTWLSEKQDDVFVVTTANDFKKLLDDFPEFGRKGRFDQIFWVGLPSDAARAEIFSIHLKAALSRDYLAFDPAEVDAVADQQHIAGVQGSTPFERLCNVLGNGAYSQHLTGAEIEYAITAAKYAVYSRASAGAGLAQLTPGVLAEAALDAKDRALYRQGTDDAVRLSALQDIAKANGWPSV